MNKLQIITVNEFYVIKSLNHIFLGNLFNKYNLNYKEFFEYCEEKYKISTKWNEPWFYSKKDALEVIEYLEGLMIMAKLTNNIKEVKNNNELGYRIINNQGTAQLKLIYEGDEK